jgi:phage virion morphogenesis protein
VIEIKVDDRQVQSMLKKLAAKASDLKPAMRAISQIMLDAVEENFEQGGRPKWTPLAPGTIAERLRKGTWPGQILVRSAGGLAASISASYDATSATVGTNKPYAAIHQFGGRTRPHVIRPKGKKALAWAGGRHPVKSVNPPGSQIPARPFLALMEDDRREIVAVMKRNLEVVSK